MNSNREATLRTKDSALEVLLKHVRKLRDELTEEIALDVLSDELVKKIFESAWKHQFDKERGDFLKRCRELVQIEIDSRFEDKTNADSQA
jgi:hypothetical protein